MTLRSIRTRLALLVFAITLAAVGVVYLYVAPSLEGNLREQKVDSLVLTARRLAPQLSEAGRAPIEELRGTVARLGDRANAQVTVLRVDETSVGVQTEIVADSTGQVRPRDLQFAIADEAARQERVARGRETSARGPLAQAAIPIVRGGGVEQVVVLSAPLNDVERNVAFVRERTAVAGAIALVLALAAGFWLATRLARRIERLERAARRVAAGDLTGRFEVDSEDELGRLAVALDDMQRQLAQLDYARKRFIATASHELRTPIFSLGGFLELLLDEDLDADTRDAFLLQLRDQVERLKKLSTDLLDLSKLEAGALELRPEPTDLEVLMRAISSEFQPALARHDSHLELRLDRRALDADVDPERVAQIMRILIDNALTHTPRGTNMVVTTGRQDGVVRLSVRDFGEGIKRQALGRIFEPFYTSDDAQGSGLGLAIARELAERMNGTLTVEALAGRTTFTLELPA